MAKSEYKLGETFQYGRIKLKVEKQTETCKGCFLSKVCSYGLFDSFIIISAGYCRSFERDDNTDIVFKKVED